MNIFFLIVNDDEACARAHCDKHLQKMIIELAQMLYSAHHLAGTVFPAWATVYKLAYKHHPMTKWVALTNANYQKTLQLALALADEYKYRFPGRTHKTIGHLKGFLSFCFPHPHDKIGAWELTIPKNLKSWEDVQKDFQQVYRGKTQIMKMQFTHRPIPSFLSDLF